MFKKSESPDSPCRYIARYVCDCAAARVKPLVIIDVRIKDHKEVELAGLYLFGERQNPADVKFCPGCGVTIPTLEAILTMEELTSE